MTTFRILIIWIVFLVTTVGYVSAQTANLPSTSVIIIDKQRVLSETLYGQRLMAEMRQMEQLQIADNKRLLQELELEEARLTKQRSSMDADEFRVLAVNFDEKVQFISNQQQAKNQTRKRLQASPALSLAFFSSFVVSSFASKWNRVSRGTELKRETRARRSFALFSRA